MVEAGGVEPLDRIDISITCDHCGKRMAKGLRRIEGIGYCESVVSYYLCELRRKGTEGESIFLTQQLLYGAISLKDQFWLDKKIPSQFLDLINLLPAL